MIFDRIEAARDRLWGWLNRRQVLFFAVTFTAVLLTMTQGW